MVVVVVVVVVGGGDVVELELELEEECGWWVLLLLLVECRDLLFPFPMFGDFFWGEIFDLILQRVSSFLI